MKPAAKIDKKTKKDPAVAELLEQRMQLAALIGQSRRSQKLKERKWGKNIAGSHSSTESALSTPNTLVMTDLVSHVQDIEDVEMETGDEKWEIPDL